MSLEESWKITLNHPKCARVELPIETNLQEASECNKLYMEFIVHNELELAMNSLDDLGDLCNGSFEFWHQLKLAALNMGLTNDAKRFHAIKTT